MLRRLTRLLITILIPVLLVTLCSTAAEARGHHRHKHRHHHGHHARAGKSLNVFAVTRAAQDWYHSRLLVKWRPVSGAVYQMRWSYTPSRLSASKVVLTGTSGGTYSGALDRGKTWYFQVRAIRSGVTGPWSAARALKFTNTWPGLPTLSANSLPGAVKFNWAYTPYASRYRVRYSAAWYGAWPSSPTYVDRTSGGWVGQTARSSTYRIPTRPTAGDNFLAVDYANPVFGQVEANDSYRAGATHLSRWVPQWATPPTPAPGDALRMGSYNVALYPTGTRAAAIATNISSHGVTLVALQEANKTTATAVRGYLGGTWRTAPSGTNAQQQILYRSDKFQISTSGTFTVPNPKTPSDPAVEPWARFTPVSSHTAQSQSFYVGSLHFSEDSSKTPVQRNRDTGLAAQAAMRGINSVNSANEPVIMAGDLRYGREPYGDPVGYTPAQPTFVRGGYYDSMAAVKRSGYQYSIVNNDANGTPRADQKPHPSGLGPRSDHILVKGFRGSFNYVNVVNWSKNGLVPSDHNLIYADLAIPYKTS